ncbi:GNAT family N-acetyltransferase [Clostridium chromiireducens]|uniref:Acetyltransferase (GNAT) family protein n=1 Tax=Clostridium chromiireducens TaxID=225345 RepID=A0A1V4IFD7_9CLOT|nr:GNAT family N-acetyltransferase [Clostridium chromiireducens]OPJ58718.1 acetyltransferase (GNAT) family protein [Clostridium chromiireducens]
MNLNECLISKDKNLLQIDRICELLKMTYWASKRDKETILKSMENSVCYGAYYDDVQVGFARVITDYATNFYICDVIIDEKFQRKGLGKKLIKEICDDNSSKSLLGLLITEDAHKLYEKFGFEKDSTSFMCKKRSE